VRELLKKFFMEEAKEISTLITSATNLDVDEIGPFVD